jgi:hypothetical protein
MRSTLSTGGVRRSATASRRSRCVRRRQHVPGDRVEHASKRRPYAPCVRLGQVCANYFSPTDMLPEIVLEFYHSGAYLVSDILWRGTGFPQLPSAVDYRKPPCRVAFSDILLHLVSSGAAPVIRYHGPFPHRPLLQAPPLIIQASPHVAVTAICQPPPTSANWGSRQKSSRL